ncbi:ABC transporter substrate-binding protein [Rhizobium sp. S152]|uniref:ABC transporter substrate-binding protein n=1 Tax=Rhizobium sp. S152 TaxID=3055038 RepID=UPI0025A996C4|nr:ABC transporter substrate-binding protein [Rhizobium sp. S152]MDM9627702.1 ABC transporter substrate-binding protein [Rhizobium sp. S152]
MNAAAFSTPRRSFLIGAAAAIIGPPSLAAPQPRIVSLSWAISETLLAMGTLPIAVAEKGQYTEIVVDPPVPVSVVDCGLQGSPNFELLSQLKPDLILIQSWQSELTSNLERIAPVATIEIYTGKENALDAAVKATSVLGTIIGFEEAAASLVERINTRFALLSQQHRPGPVIITQMIDDVSLTAFTVDSLFGSALSRLGFKNAWTAAPTLMWGGSIIGVEQLAEIPDATVLLIDAPGLAPTEKLTQSTIWKILPAVKEGRFHRLPAFWGFGALPTALRFAEAATTVMRA